MQATHYFLRYRGEITGPFTQDQLQARKRTGQLSVIHNVSTDRENWTLAKDLDWLFPAPPPIQAPALPAPPAREGIETTSSEQPSPPTPPARRRSPAIVFAAAFLLTFGAAALAYIALWSPWNYHTWGAARANGIDPARLDEHVCLVVQEEHYEETNADGSTKVTFKPSGSGSGFVVTSDGYIITNRHVVAFLNRDETIVSLPALISGPKGKQIRLPPKISVRFKQDEWHDAEVAYVSRDRDVAVIKINKSFQNPFQITSRFQRGDKVAALGFPGASMRLAGEVLNADNVDESNRKLAYEFIHSNKVSLRELFPAARVGLNQTPGEITAPPISSSSLTSGGVAIQTNTYIRHGNSGGPLVNFRGQVVGIVTMGLTAKAELVMDENNKAGVQLDMDGEGLNAAFSISEMLPELLLNVPDLRGKLLIDGTYQP